MTAYKQPVSVLVVIYTAELDVLLLERAAHPGFWQSVTGSRENGCFDAGGEVFEAHGVLQVKSPQILQRKPLLWDLLLIRESSRKLKNGFAVAR